MSEPMFVVLTGPSGAGKSSVVERLLAADPRLAFSISTTTRPQRAGEVDGEHYHFVDDEKFTQLLAADAFVEWATVHDNRYGTRRRDLQALMDTGRVPLLDVDVQGGLAVLDLFPREAVSIFLFPPSWEELERRLTGRGTDDAQVVQRRLENARREVSFAHRYEYYLINDDLDEVVARLQAIITAEGCRRVRWPQPPL